MRNDRYFTDMDEVIPSPPAPVRAVASGMGAGLGVILLGTVVARALGWTESLGMLMVYTVVPALGAAVAAGVVATMMGSSWSHAIKLAVGAFFATYLTSWVVEYLLIMGVLAGGELKATSPPSPEITFPMRGYVIYSFLHLVGGMTLGMLFGGPRWKRPTIR